MIFFKKILLFLFAILSFQSVLSQHIDIDKKILSFLAIEDTINIKFSYKDVLFDGGNLTEEDFLKVHKAVQEEHHGKEASEDWLDTYYQHKDSLWANTFTKTLNKKLSEYKNAPFFVINSKNSKYTMEVHTIWMYFGYNVIVGKQPSKVTMNLTFYESKTPKEELFKTEISRAMGTNNEAFNLSDWPSFRRVGKGYERGAYKLAQSLKRIVN